MAGPQALRSPHLTSNADPKQPPPTKAAMKLPSIDLKSTAYSAHPISQPQASTNRCLPPHHLEDPSVARALSVRPSVNRHP